MGFLDQFTDDQIIAAVRDGGRVHHILNRLTFSRGNQIDRPALHRRLCKLEAAGKVHRSSSHSYINSIYWMTAAPP